MIPRLTPISEQLCGEQRVKSPRIKHTHNDVFSNPMPALQIPFKVIFSGWEKNLVFLCGRQHMPHNFEKDSTAKILVKVG